MKLAKFFLDGLLRQPVPLLRGVYVRKMHVCQVCHYYGNPFYQNGIATGRQFPFAPLAPEVSLHPFTERFQVVAAVGKGDMADLVRENPVHIIVEAQQVILYAYSGNLDPSAYVHVGGLHVRQQTYGVLGIAECVQHHLYLRQIVDELLKLPLYRILHVDVLGIMYGDQFLVVAVKCIYGIKERRVLHISDAHQVAVYDFLKKALPGQWRGDDGHDAAEQAVESHIGLKLEFQHAGFYLKFYLFPLLVSGCEYAEQQSCPQHLQQREDAFPDMWRNG